MKKIIPILAIIIIAVGAIAYFGNTEYAVNACQNKYAYEPAYRCCGETLSESNPGINIPANNNFYCPTGARRCEVYPTTLSGISGTGWYKGRINCQVNFLGQYWCDDAVRLQENEWVDIQSGQHVFQNSGSTQQLRYKTYSLKLCEGSFTEACPVVAGSTQCGFETNEDIFLPDGKTGAPGNFAYTVPYGSCYVWYPDFSRHVVGDTCEDCDNNYDCIQLYGKKYTKNGVDYAVASCDGQNLQLFGCVPEGSNVCVDWRDANDNNVYDSGEECLEWGKQTLCDLVTTQAVQCCPGTDSCGGNSFCNPEKYTCEVTAECQYDYECGVVTECTSLPPPSKLKKPVCNDGQCGWDSTNVECCIKSDCPSGKYCDFDNTCKTEPVVKDVCPFACCQNEEAYFDKDCPSSSPVCCADNTCESSVSECSGNNGDQCVADSQCDDEDPCTLDICVDRTTGNTCLNKYNKELPGCGGIVIGDWVWIAIAIGVVVVALVVVVLI